MNKRLIAISVGAVFVSAPTWAGVKGPFDPTPHIQNAIPVQEHQAPVTQVGYDDSLGGRGVDGALDPVIVAPSTPGGIGGVNPTPDPEPDPDPVPVEIQLNCGTPQISYGGSQLVTFNVDSVKTQMDNIKAEYFEQAYGYFYPEHGSDFLVTYKTNEEGQPTETITDITVTDHISEKNGNSAAGMGIYKFPKPSSSTSCKVEITNPAYYTLSNPFCKCDVAFGGNYGCGQYVTEYDRHAYLGNGDLFNYKRIRVMLKPNTYCSNKKPATLPHGSGGTFFIK